MGTRNRNNINLYVRFSKKINIFISKGKETIIFAFFIRNRKLKIKIGGFVKLNTKTDTKKKETRKKNQKKNKKDASIMGKLSAAEKKAMKTVQDSIPFVRVYEDGSENSPCKGIIETEDSVFTKSYLINDTNYSDAGEEKQEIILETFKKILTAFQTNCGYEITINNRTVDQAEFNNKVLMQYANDDYDTFRMQHNELVIDMMQQGKNNLHAEKYLTITVNEDSIEEALNKFVAIERDIDREIKKINGIGLEVLSLSERLEILHDIYNGSKVGNFKKTFDLDTVVKQGISIKDIIGPTVMDFTKNDYFVMDDRYVRTFFLKSIPSRLNSTLLEALSNVSANSLISVHYDIQPQDKAVSFASAQVTNIGGEVVKAQKNLTKAGASPDLISPKLQASRDDASRLLAQLTEGNENLYHVTIAATIFADNKDDLDSITTQIMTRAKEQLCALDVLKTQQEQGFNTSLPLGLNLIHVHRVLPTDSVSAIQPFSTQELQIKNGFYYGLNQLSKNIIVYNRGMSNNQNGVILGCPGAGKSFAAKMEMYQAFLNTRNSQIFIIDPEREYAGLGQALKATIFPIEPGGKVFINPLDLDISRDDEGGDPFAEKVDFVISIVEAMLGGRNTLNGYLKSIIDNTLQNLYAPYLRRLEVERKTIDIETAPTLKEFWEALKARKEPEARNLADAIQMYCVGSLNLFAHHTNIDTNNRMIIYDTKHIGTNLQELGMQICLNDIWNRMIANRKKEIRTWFYIDEFYLLLHQKSSAEYLQMVWKRARKWMGTPTGITQNVSDLLASEEGNTILKTSDFALLLNQSFQDRLALAQIYELSEEQQGYVNQASAGEGLIYTSRSVVPFENHVPTTSDIYKLLSTKASDAESIVK